MKYVVTGGATTDGRGFAGVGRGIARGGMNYTLLYILPFSV